MGVYIISPKEKFARTLQIRTQSKQLGKQHHIQHLAQVTHTWRAARARFETDNALDRGDVAKAPVSERGF